MCDRSAASVLLSAADRDLSALRKMLDSRQFAIEVFGFHAQQAAEKSLKAWLAILGREYPHTHNLRVLLALLEEAGTDVSGLWDLVALSAFAVQFRYDAYNLKGESLDRAAITRRLKTLHNRVKARLRKRRGD